MIGPGKYDELCTLVRERCGLAGETVPEGGGVIVIVFGGDKGNGFSCQADLATTLALPDVLENVARKMRDDIERTELQHKLSTGRARVDNSTN